MQFLYKNNYEGEIFKSDSLYVCILHDDICQALIMSYIPQILLV